MDNGIQNSISFRALKTGLIALLCIILSTMSAATCPSSNEDYMALFGKSGFEFPAEPIVAFRSSSTDAVNG